MTVYELRQYTHHSGQRNVLIDLFDREFVEPQEEMGIRVHGQFRDENRPDRFVWLRGFADMPARGSALDTYYSGPVWQAHQQAALATLIDFDDVRLLRPADPDGALPLPTSRPPVGATELPPSRFTATVYDLPKPVSDEFRGFFTARVAPLLVDSGASIVARLETEYAENNYPALPIRTADHAFIWLARFDDADRLAEHTRLLAGSRVWRDEVQPDLLNRLVSPPETLTLSPTTRSALR